MFTNPHQASHAEELSEVFGGRCVSPCFPTTWLFGTGLIGLIGIKWRREAA